MAQRKRRRPAQHSTTVARTDSPVLIPLKVGGEVVGHFRAASKPPLWAFLRFADASRQGIGTEDMEGLAAMYRLIRAAIDPRDWPGFEQAADEHQPDAGELLELVTEAMTAATRRPTGRPAGSSAGPRPTGRTSTAGSSSPATRPRLAADLEAMTPVTELARRMG